MFAFLLLTLPPFSGGQYFDPHNYLQELPSLNMPYVNEMVIPSNIRKKIKPTPVVTKVVDVVTKYVNRSPVCLKAPRNKPKCRSTKNPNQQVKDLEYVVRTDGYFVEGQTGETANGNFKVDGSEFPRNFEEVSYRRSTPFLDKKTQNLLIDDRLDHLEEILPHYTRRRMYQTSTVTVTKTRNVDVPMATLMVKNCIPEGVQICKKSRRAKMEDMDEMFGFG